MPSGRKRIFNDQQRLQIAKELFSGKARKRVAFDWQAPRGRIDEIFNDFIEWQMVWKAEKKYQSPIARDGIEAQYGLNDTWPGDSYETSGEK